MRRESSTFDPQTELFLSNAPTLPELEPVGPIELSGLATAHAPRRTLGAWVIGTMIICASILVQAYAR